MVWRNKRGNGWVPDLAGRRGPLYRLITDALERDIASGRLEPGTALPPHRVLADVLGVTVGTVTRAYGEARRRGLVAGEVGRGTYVLASAGGSSAPQRQIAAPVIDLKFNQPSLDESAPWLNRTLKELARRRNLMSLFDYQPAPGRERHRLAGVKWVSKTGVSATPDEVVICNGLQQGLMAAIASLTRPGDLILTEALNYPGIRRLVGLFQVRLRGLPVDRHGLIPEAVAEACARERVAAVICTPSIHNPTATTMPLERRRRLAEIAEANGLAIVEDDTYGQLAEAKLPTLYELARGNRCYLAGTSKSLAPGLRIAYLVAPEETARRCAEVVHATTWTTSSLMAEIAAMWITDGTADALIRWHRKEIAARQAVARKYLGHTGYLEHAASYHIWLPLAEPMRADEVVLEAQAQGVAIAPGSVFAVEPDFIPQAVRISLGSPRTMEMLETGLSRLAAILEQRPALRSMVI